MLTRSEMESREREVLAPYASLSAESFGRRYPEEEHSIRTAFQRDKDRIIHCTAFRRLEYKTQVFVNDEGDHYRTRLTHSLEVSQIARAVARPLRLNEDLAEAIALAHDLGHTPFGHSGESALNGVMQGKGGFEHKAQGLRVVEVLEQRYPHFPGLNLTAEVRGGILKGARPYDGQQPPFPVELMPTLECQLVDVADEIAYNAHDVDDGLARGYLQLADLSKTEIWRRLAWPSTEDFASAPQKIRIRAAVRRMIDAQATDLIEATLQRLKAGSFQNRQEALECGTELVAFSEEMAAMNREVKDFLMSHLYRHFMVVRMSEKAKRMMRELFGLYVENASQLPPDFRERIPADGLERVASDYLAGMTDRYASECYKDHFIPYLHL